MLSAKALLGRDDLAARVEIILIPQQALHTGAQQFLFFRELDVHPGAFVR